MKEELLHFIWQSKLLFHKPLRTTEGETISIVNHGLHNTNAGPDFFNAKIYIGNTLWAGNIEMHIAASEWEKHAHQKDAAYNNVILHVVYINDKPVYNSNGEAIPTLVLRSLIPTSLLQRYESLQQHKHRHIACEKIIHLPDAIHLQHWLQRLLVERLEQKCDYIKDILVKTHHHWEQSFYIITARYFGMKTNALPFEQLANMLPLTVLAKHKNNLDDILALVLGVSGLLDKMGEPYQHLHNRFLHLQNKYKLKQLDKSIWKFARTRPANFPSIRLLQFAAFIYQSSHLLSKVLECENIAELIKLYKTQTEYQGQKIALGAAAIDLLLINSVLPFVFVYGKIQHEEHLCEKALNWYEGLPSEKNAITRLFAQLGFTSKNAADSQAFIQLKNEYCAMLNCLNCSIGQQSLLHA